ncbi:MAG: hypothetical protein P9M12_05830 [Candidatus Aceula lacicola]|nr:hypothetical protein [Candidatus Aceula lacicola]
MRKCLRCNIIFDDERLVGCIYCENILVRVKDDKEQREFESCAKAEEPSAFKKPLTHQKKDYLFGALFQERTFLSSFAFSYNNMKRNKEAQRFLIQPIDIGYIVKVPLIIVNFIYSFFFHILHSQYCPRCNTRYFAFYGGQKMQHPKDACEYCQEYNQIADEIFSKKQCVNLRKLREISEEKIRQGKHSAFFDLTHRNVAVERFLDIASIVTSIAVYVYIVARLSMPFFAKIYQF